MIRSAQKQAANRADEVSRLYAQFDNDLLGLTKNMVQDHYSISTLQLK